MPQAIRGAVADAFGISDSFIICFWTVATPSLRSIFTSQSFPLGGQNMGDAAPRALAAGLGKHKLMKTVKRSKRHLLEFPATSLTRLLDANQNLQKEAFNPCLAKVEKFSRIHLDYS